MARDYSKKSRAKDPSYVKRRSNAPDVQRYIPMAKVSTSSPTGLLRGDRMLSAMNRRLYRQCGNYRMKIELVSPTNQSEIKVFTLSNTWVIKNSIQLARRMHDKAMEEERAMGVQARWYDFRINPNSAAVDDYVQALRATPFAGTTLATPPGEYAYSQIEDAAGTLQSFVLPMGGSTTGYDIFAEYDKTGNAANAPADHLSAGAYDGVDASVEAENIVSLSNKGNLPPYGDETFINDVIVQVGSLHRNSGGNQRLSTGFFDAPLGLVWIQHTAPDSNPLMAVEFQRGGYKGVHMEAY